MTIEPTCDCPVCFGEGVHDFGDMDAVLGEHFSDDDLDSYFDRTHWGGIVACGECERTGIVTVRRARELRAQAAAFVDQVMAKVADEDRSEEA